METDTSEKGIETLIVRSLIDAAGNAAGNPEDCDREYTVGLAQFPAFMVETQPRRGRISQWKMRPPSDQLGDVPGRRTPPGKDQWSLGLYRDKSASIRIIRKPGERHHRETVFGMVSRSKGVAGSGCS